MTRANNKAVSEGCTPRIAIFPLRYSVHARPPGATNNASYQASPLPLELGFPALKRGQYGLRGLDSGFVYVLDETRGDEFVWKIDEEAGQFVELDKRSATLEKALKFYKVGQTVPHIWARSASRVHIVVTGTLLTNAKLRELRRNDQGIRDKVALTLDMPAWKAESPDKSTFAAEHMSTWVNGFQPDAPAPTVKREPARRINANLVAKQMKSFSPCKQLVVVPPNPIAVVQDLTALVMGAQEDAQTYITDVEKGDANQPERSMRFRKKMTADLIDKVYESVYANHYGIDATKDRDALERRIAIDTRRWDEQRRATNVYRREPYLPPAPERLSDRATKSRVVSAKAMRYLRRVNEGARVAFLERYDKEMDDFHAALVDHKNDRCLWLRTYLTPRGAADLGAGYKCYDLAQTESSTAHATAFACCVEGMQFGPTTPIADKPDQEHALFKQWWEMPWAGNPLMQNMANDKGYLDVLKGNKADVAADTLIGKSLTPMVHRQVASRLMGQVHVYVLSRLHNETPALNYKGAVRDTIDAFVHRLAGTGTQDDAWRLVQNLDPAGRYGKHTTTVSMTLADAERQLHEMAGSPPVIARGSMARGAGDAITLIDTRAVSSGMRSASPRLARVDVGTSALVLLLSAVNLHNAIISLSGDESPEGYATYANLMAAVAGVGSGITGLAGATRVLAPAAYERVGVRSDLLRGLASVRAVRFFGYAGAIADAVTNWFKAAGQYKIGNQTAGNFYTAAGFAMGLGGAAMTTGSAAAIAAMANGGVGFLASFGAMSLGVPVWGWIIAGVVFLGLGLWWIFQAEKSLFTRPEFWLNDCVFGKRELMGRGRSEQYASWAQEEEGYLNAFHGPQMANWEWLVVEAQTGSNTHILGNGSVFFTYRPRLELKIAYPLPGKGHLLRVEATGVAQLPAEPQVKSIGLPEELPSGGILITYEITKMANSVSYSVRMGYTPDKVGKNLEALVAIGETPYYYHEGVQRASVDPRMLAPAPWEQPGSMYA